MKRRDCRRWRLYTARVKRSGIVDWCVELLQPLGAVRARRMFGGHGLYVDELFIAIIADEQLYLKADAESAARFEQAGGRPFTYPMGDKLGRINYWTVPAEAMESPAELMPWARLALQSALQARAAARPRPAKRPASKAGKAAKPAAAKAARPRATKPAPRG